jgi:hypothetical protein
VSTFEESRRGVIGMEMLSTIVLLTVAFAFAFMALDALRRAK